MSEPRRSLLLRLLDRVERAGNRLPDPLSLFAILCVAVAVASWAASAAGVSVLHPGTGETIRAVDLLTREGVRRMLTEAVKNFTAFPPLGIVLAMVVGAGAAERAGLFGAMLRGMVAWVPPWALGGALVFAGVNSSLAADAGYVVLIPLGPLLYAGFGRHPLAGLAAAFAGIGGGFSANLVVTSLDPLLGGLTTAAARLVEPEYIVQPTANYWFMLASTLLLTGVGALVTTRIVEPRLGPWEGAAPAGAGVTLTAAERRGLLAAAVAAGLVVLGALALVVPADAPLRADDGGIKPFYEALIPLLIGLFLASTIAYGWFAGTVRSDRDLARLAGEGMGTMGSYIVLAFVVAQFVAWFNWSNLGVILAVSGAQTLRAAGIGGLPLLLAFVVLSSLVNVFIGSASAKWSVMAPVFVPMLLLLGIPPEVTQAAYRIGDSATNIVTPLLPYFPLVLTVAVRHVPNAGMGTLLALMAPYSIAFLAAWCVLFSLWWLAGIPFGPGGP